jgi:flagellar biosynthesis/type III secretory pathway chaperone
VDSAQLIKAFTATVQASLHGLQTIEPVLERERDALTGRDPQHLEQVVRDKLVLLNQLEHGVRARDQLQQSAGFEAGPDGGSRLVETLDHPVLRRDWTQLTALARRVAELNDRNGQLVVQGQRDTRTALGVLTGRNAKDDTYTTLRRKAGAVASCSLGKV